MRLTNLIRDSFVTAAMNDVPKVDYEKQIKDQYQLGMLDLMPPELVGLYEKNKMWFSHSFKHIQGVSTSFQIVSPSDYGVTELKPKRKAEIDRLVALHKEQRRTRNDLQDKLKAVAYSVTTRKALAEALPEFEKYLPADEPAACRTLPAVANLVADFTKAGWPKSQQTAVQA